MAGGSATVVDAETFKHVTELETRQAARLQYPISVVTVRAERGRDEPARLSAAAGQLAEIVRGLVRDTDLLEILPFRSTIHILLVGCDLEDLDRIIERIIAAVSAAGSAPAVQPGPFTLSLGGSSFPATTTTSAELIRQADTLADEARRGRSPHPQYRLPRRFDGDAY